MTMRHNYLLPSIAVALMLCATQVMGNTILILGCLAFFMLLLVWACFCDYTLPVLLFFLAWSPLLRLSPDSFSFFTFGQVLVCFISVVKRRFCFKRYHIVIGVLLFILTLCSKLIDGSALELSYIAFLMLIVLFPVVKEECGARKYDFFQVVTMFSVGVVLAAMCALYFATYPNISQYIRVDEYTDVLRRSGFYGDANFYTAQITAAMGGVLLLLLTEEKKGRMLFLWIILFLLLYSGFLSGSKSFVLVSVAVLAIWIVALLRMRGSVGLKLLLLGGLILSAVFIATSVLFSGLIDVLVVRFSTAEDLDSLTTGRVTIWISYIKEIFGDIKVFFLGRGFTNVKVNGRGSHNTLLQSFYQFGILGVPILLCWIIAFFRDTPSESKRRGLSLESLIVIAGVVLPWLAIDMLFFDEFFLLQWYMFMEMRYLDSERTLHKRINQNK